MNLGLMIMLESVSIKQIKQKRGVHVLITILIENSKRKTKKVWNKVFKPDCFGKSKDATYYFFEIDKCVHCKHVHECGIELIENMLEEIKADHHSTPDVIEKLNKLVKRLKMEEQKELGCSFTTKRRNKRKS